MSFQIRIEKPKSPPLSREDVEKSRLPQWMQQLYHRARKHRKFPQIALLKPKWAPLLGLSTQRVTLHEEGWLTANNHLIAQLPSSDR